MEEKYAAFESAATESNGVAHNADHGWQKVTYAKKQRKPSNVTNGTDSRANSNKLVPNGNDGIFRSLELHSEDRRRRILEARLATYAEFDDAPVRSKLRSCDDYDDDDDEDRQENGKAEEVKKVKQKKPKKQLSN